MSTTQPTGSYDVNAEEPDLRRVMGPKLLLLFIVGDILGARGLRGDRPDGGRGRRHRRGLPFVVAFVVATLTALSYLELVTKYPQAAGAALYTHKAFGIHFVTFLVAFAVICSGITSASTSSNAARAEPHRTAVVNGWLDEAPGTGAITAHRAGVHGPAGR